MPPAKAKAKKRSKPTMTTMVPGASTVYACSLDGRSQTRIQPHDNDVLSGRGGNVNSHPGNARFRSWVAERKHLYTMGHTKDDKSLIAKEVVQLVYGQNPPGRFLQKDPESTGNGWWYEMEEDKILAKTAQALREGAPQIKKAFTGDLPAARKRVAPSKRAATGSSSGPMPEYQSSIAKHDLPQHFQFARTNVSSLPAHGPIEPLSLGLPTLPTKQVRMDYNGTIVRPNEDTPPLLPSRSEPLLLPPLSLPAANTTTGGLRRSHSLALSDFSVGDFMNEEFVNPFENESDELDSKNGGGGLLKREASSSSSLSTMPKLPAQFLITSNEHKSTESHGDMGGIGALLRNIGEKSGTNDGVGDTVHSNGVRQTTGDGDDEMSSNQLPRIPSMNVVLHRKTPSRNRSHDWSFLAETEFDNGVKYMNDALLSSGEDENDEIMSFPLRGSGLLRTASSSSSRRGLDGRQ